MFTGLVEAICTVKSIQPSASAGSMLLKADIKELAEDARIGDSIAINGICLTVSALSGTIADFDVSSETVARSTLGKLSTGKLVNAERAMKASDRFGGHFVQGHVDGTASIRGKTIKGEFASFEFSADAGIIDQLIEKGSVSIDGISLTIAKLGTESFTIEVIPQTIKKTTLQNARAGDVVNIEIDILTKIVKNRLDKILPQKQGLTVEKLKELGF
jgi:riboflavin synthase